MSMIKIVVVEDENDITELVKYNLEREGFEVKTADNGLAALEVMRQEDPNLVLLDLMLPGIDGLEVCRKVKSDPLTSRIPIIMVTAKGEESDIVLGLGLGADDYITKPFSVKELVARVKAVLRRGPIKEESSKGERLIIDSLVIDASKHQIYNGSERLSFTATEFRLLHFLASHPGRVFTRDQLMSRVIGQDTNVVDRNIDVHIRSIRKKLGESQYMIETIRGVGYRFMDME